MIRKNTSNGPHNNEKTFQNLALQQEPHRIDKNSGRNLGRCSGVFFKMDKEENKTTV